MKIMTPAAAGRPTRALATTAKAIISAITLAAVLAGAPAIGADGAAKLKTGDRVVGIAHPIDGDSLFVETADRGRVEVRLFGVSAPEWDAPLGPLATRVLHKMVRGKTVDCAVLDIDRYKRAVAVCSVEAYGDIGEAMVLSGFATPYRKYLRGADPYEDILLAAEGEACALGMGLWRGRPDGICTDE